MKKDINTLAKTMQQVFENRNGGLSGGFISISDFNSTINPVEGTVNGNRCQNGECIGSSNERKCLNTERCDGNSHNGGGIDDHTPCGNSRICTRINNENGGFSNQNVL